MNGQCWAPKDRKTKTEVDRCIIILYEGESTTERRSTRTENMENENSMYRPQNMEKAEEEDE